MPSEFPYATFASYSPRGTSETSLLSQRLCGAIKAGREDVLRTALPHLQLAPTLQPFLAADVTLVPVPRSAPLTQGALWPARVIADVLRAGGFGREVLPLVERVTAVPKSATSLAKDRPLWHAHYASLAARPGLIAPTKITLVDDVLTMGRTTYACAQRLHEAFPQAELRIFAIIRTLGLVANIATVIDPTVGKITGYSSGKTFRDP